MKRFLYSNCFLSGTLTAVTLLMVLSYCQVLLNGKNVFITADLYHQYAAFAALLARKIQEGSNLFYTFQEGMGTNTALLFAFYSFSPVNLCYLLIQDIELATVVVLTVKCMLAAITFTLYCEQNLKCKSKIVIFFAIPYVLCSYQFAMMKIATLSDALYLLPLTLVVIKQLIKQERKLQSHVGLCLVYTLTFICNFYAGFLVGLASFAYFIICLIMNYRKKWFSIVIQYGICVMIAGLLAAAFLLPTGYYALYMNADTVQDFSYQGVGLNSIISSMMAFRSYSIGGNAPYIYCGIPAVLLLPYYFLNKKFSIKERVIAAGSLLILILGIVISPLYHLLHMMNRPDGYTVRFAYLISFIVLSIAVREYSGMQKLHMRTVWIWPFLLIVTAFSVDLLKKWIPADENPPLSIISILLNLCFIAIWIVLYFYKSKAKDQQKLILAAILLIMLETGLGGYFILSGDSYMSRDYYYEYHEQAEETIKNIQETDSGLYRLVYLNSLNKNQQSVYGYHGIGFFSSTKSAALSEVMLQLGYVSSGFTIYEMGRTEATDLLFAEKYVIDAPIPLNGETCSIVPKKYWLSYGYMVSDAITDMKLKSDNAFANINHLVSTMTGEEISPFIMYNGSITLIPENAGIVQNEEGILMSRMDDSIATTYLRVEIPHIEGQKAYVYFTSDYNIMDSASPTVRTLENREAMLYSSSLLSTPHIVEMETQEDKEFVYVFMPPGTISQYLIRNIYFAYYDENALQEAYQNLKEHQLLVQEYEDGYIRGTVTATKEQPYLFLSIPYEEGWQILIDGIPEKAQAVIQSAFLGVRLEPGTHEIELKYTAPGSKIGLWLTALGCVLLVILVICDKILQEKEKTRGNSDAGKN